MRVKITIIKRELYKIWIFMNIAIKENEYQERMKNTLFAFNDNNIHNLNQRHNNGKFIHFLWFRLFKLLVHQLIRFPSLKNCQGMHILTFEKP